jgi:hypothetical protein
MLKSRASKKKFQIISKYLPSTKQNKFHYTSKYPKNRLFIKQKKETLLLKESFILKNKISPPRIFHAFKYLKSQLSTKRKKRTLETFR